MRVCDDVAFARPRAADDVVRRAGVNAAVGVAEGIAPVTSVPMKLPWITEKIGDDVCPAMTPMSWFAEMTLPAPGALPPRVTFCIWMCTPALTLPRACDPVTSTPMKLPAMTIPLAGVLDLVETVARQRWSRPLDLVDASPRPWRPRRRWTPPTPAASSTASRTSCSGSAASSPATASWAGSSATARPRPRARPRCWTGCCRGRVSPVTEQLLRNVLTGPHVGTRRERDRAAVRGGQPPPRPVGRPRDQRRRR